MSILTKFKKVTATPITPTLKPQEVEDKSEKAEKANDFDCSVDVLYQGFIVWHRLQRDGIVHVKTRDDVMQQLDTWQNKYPEQFIILHRGSHCSESLLIGRGKYSSVYQRMGSAFKVVRVGQDRSPDHVATLRCNLKELAFFHSMNHPNLMRCTQSQLVMEHGSIRKIIHQMSAARCNLQHMIDSHEITCFQDLAYIFGGIARGIQYMHRLKIVHGDIKPSNVLISPQFKPMLSDFTLTTFEGKGSEIAFGTLYWRAPECLLMRECTGAADVWALGMMMLDCLYGCTYMASILHSKNDTDLLAKLSCIIDPPPEAWLKKYLCSELDAPIDQDELKDSLLKPDPLWCDRVSERNQLHIALQPNELEQIQDLIAKILVWMPGERLSIEDVLKHPVFSAFPVVTPFPAVTSPFKTKLNPPSLVKPAAPDPVDHPAQQITWRDRSEREFIQRWTRYYYHERFNSRMPAEEDWLLQDITLLIKRLMDHLRLIECTFNLKNIIRVCGEFMYFLWKNEAPTNPLFECQAFHILTLLGFAIFPLNVAEKFLHGESGVA